MTKRFQPTALRRAVANRDEGVCALCSRDCGAIDNALLRLRMVASDVGAQWASLLGVAWKNANPHSTWEADHVSPLCEAGVDSLDNLRTLCRWCHKAETSTLMSRLFAGRSMKERRERRHRALDGGAR